MPLQAKQNLPLFVAKRATLSGDGLPDITTISLNIMKRPEETSHQGFSTGIVKPTAQYNAQNDREIHFVELPQINYDAAKGTIPPPVFNNPIQTPAAPRPAEKPQFICNAVLDLARLPDEWVAKQGQEIPVIKIRIETGERTLTQATYLFDQPTGNFFIEAKGFL